MSNFSEAIVELNDSLQQKREEGMAYSTRLNGVRPRYLIRSLSPLLVERYGRVTNKGPQLYGNVGIVALFAGARQLDPEGMGLAFAAVPIGEVHYGVTMSAVALNAAAVELGRQDLAQFTYL